MRTLLVFSLLLSGCVSTHMKRYIGKDVRYIVLDDGDPERAMDMPDGTRAFQFYWGGGSAAVPTQTTTTGELQLVGNSVLYSEQRLQTGGFIVESKGCLVTYFARWDAAKNGWIVTGIQYPKRLAC